MTNAVNITEINEPGVVGLFARPDAAGPWPAVVAFGGSSGGLGPAGGWAPALASEGFAVLAVAYFAAPGLPSALVDIEVEVVERAVTWLFAGGHVADEAVGVMGISRGSELALLAGILLDRVGPIVALAPSGISWCGLGAGGPVDAPAWTFRGQPIPYAAMAGGAAPPTFTAARSPSVRCSTPRSPPPRTGHTPKSLSSGHPGRSCSCPARTTPCGPRHRWPSSSPAAPPAAASHTRWCTFATPALATPGAAYPAPPVKRLFSTRSPASRTPSAARSKATPRPEPTPGPRSSTFSKRSCRHAGGRRGNRTAQEPIRPPRSAGSGTGRAERRTERRTDVSRRPRPIDGVILSV